MMESEVLCDSYCGESLLDVLNINQDNGISLMMAC